MSALATTTLFALLPIGALLLAGIVALARPAGPKMRSAVMHLAGGVVFAVVAIELLPAIIHSVAIIAVVVGFSAGTALMLLLRQLLDHDDDEDEGAPTGMIVAIGVDLVVDGLMLGLGFAAGQRAGVLLAVGLTLETVSLGLALSTKLRASGASTRRVLGILGVLGVALAVGAVIGAVGLQYAPKPLLPGLLAFGAAALLFLVTEELLEEAHEVKETPVLTAMFFVGFLALMVLEMAGGVS